MALARKWIASPNYSSRSASVRLIIVHTAEGALTIESLGNFFANPSSAVSSHAGADDKPGLIGEYVKPDRSAWTAGNANPYSVQIELCAFARWDRAEWLRHPVMLDNCRAWIAEEAARFGIPIVKSTDRGVCGHVDVSGPGGHYDPGPNFPWDMVLGPAPAPAPPPQHFGNGGNEDSTVATCSHPNGKRVDICTVAPDRSVRHYWSDDNANLARMTSENMGGQGKSVSCCWLDGNRFLVTVHGTNDQVWQNLSVAGRWAGWAQIPNTPLLPV